MIESCTRTMKPAPNGEEETRTLRGTEAQGQHLADPNIHRELGSQGISNGSEPLRINRDDCSSGTPSNSVGYRERAIGKILGQLRELQKSHLACSQAHQKEIENLEKQVIELLEDEQTVQ